MIRFFFSCVLLLAFHNAFGDCQDDCTAGEAICVEDCSKTGFATLGCVTRCSKGATHCVKKRCTSDPKPKSKEDSLTDTQKWRTAFPLDTEGSDFSTDNCCSGIASRSSPRGKYPMCAYVLCKQPDVAAMMKGKEKKLPTAGISDCCKTGGQKGPECVAVLCAPELQDRNWSGKLFDSNSGMHPKSIWSECANHASPVCALIKAPVQTGVPSEPSVTDLKNFRQHLEAFRRGTDYARITGQLSKQDQRKFLDAYKKDYRSVFEQNK